MHSKSKRFLSIVLCVLMLATLFPFSALSADVFAIDFDTQSLNESYSEGESFTIPVQIKNNPGVNAIGLTVSYPQDVFSIELTEGVVGASDQDVSDADFAFSGTDTLTDNGILFYAKFTVLENVTSGNYSISLGITGNEPSNLADENYEPIDCSLGSCTIKVNGTAAAANLTFTDGSWSAGFEAANSEGVSAVVPQAAPTGATYYFLGWFSGLDAAANDGIFTKENDRYVLSASKAANTVATGVYGVTFTATEFVPKYNQGELGSYNALWLKSDRTVSYDVVDMLTVKDSTVTYMVADVNQVSSSDELDNLSALKTLSAAAVAAADGGTVKLVRDIILGGYLKCDNTFGNVLTVPAGKSVTFDMNGCSISVGRTMNTSSIKTSKSLPYYTKTCMLYAYGELSVINSSLNESKLVANDLKLSSSCYLIQAVDGSISLKDITVESRAITDGMKACYYCIKVGNTANSEQQSFTMENCIVNYSYTDREDPLYIVTYGTINLTDCTVTGNGELVSIQDAKALNIKDCNFDNTSASAACSIINVGSHLSSYYRNNINIYEGNTFKSCGTIINTPDMCPTIKFYDAATVLEHADGAKTVAGSDVVVLAPAGTVLKDEGTAGSFVPGFTVCFAANGITAAIAYEEGAAVKTTDIADPVFKPEGLTSYSFGGWSLTADESDASNAVDITKISTDTKLYAIKVSHPNTPANLTVALDGGAEQGFLLFSEAIEYANTATENAVIKFYKDFEEIAEAATPYYVGKNMTINMNGHTAQLGDSTLTIESAVTLTLDDTSAAKDGRIVVNSTDGIIKTTNNMPEGATAKLNLNGGVIENVNGYGIMCYAGSAAKNYYVTVNLNGGYIKATGIAINTPNTKANVTINMTAGGIYGTTLYPKGKNYCTFKVVPADKVLSSVPLANGYYELILEHDTVTGNTAKLCVYNTDNKEYSFANNYKVKFLTDAIDAVKALALNHDLELKVEAKNVDGAAAAFDVTLTDTVTGNPVGFTAADGVEITIPATVKANTTYKLFYKEGNSWTQDSVYTTTEAADSITVKVDHFSEYMLKEAAAFGTEITVGTVKDYDVGDTVTATVKLNATQAATLRSYQFNVIVPAGLELESIELADGFKNDGSSAINGIKVAGACKGGVAIAANGEVQLATLTFKVTTAAVDEADVEISLENILVSAVDEGEDIAVDANSSEEITLHNVVITVNGGNATVGGADSLAFYAKYNEADKLYVDAARTIAATTPAVVAKDGYSLADTLFVNAADATDTAADFAALAGKTFTKTAAYTVQTAKTYTLTFSAENAHCIAIGSTVTLNEGDNIKASLPAVINDTGYENGKWYVVSGETETELADTATISADTTVKYKAAAQTHTIDLADLAALTVSDKTNISADNKVTMGKEVSFKVASGDTSVITGITVQIGDTYTNNYAVNNNGTWTVTIPAAKITDNIVVTAETDDIGTVTFKQGANATLEGADANGSVTKYIVVGQAGIYNSAADAKSNTAGTVPTATAKTGYRLADNAWAVGGCTYNTAALGNVVFADGTEITVNTVKTYTVTFTATNAILSSTGVVVDAGTDLASVVYPTVTPADGYTFTGWDKTAGAVNADTTVTAALTQDSYTITAASTPAATVTVPAGPFTYGESVNVTVVPNTGFTVTKVSYVVNGVSTELTKGADNTYALTAKGSGMIVVEANGTYTVTFTVDAAKGTVTGATSVTKAAGEKLASSDIPTVTAKGGYVFTGWSISDDGLTYAAQFEDAAYKTSTGDYVKHGTDYTFTPEVKGKVITGVTAKIGDADVTVTQNDDGSYTIAGADIVGNIDITYVELDAEFEFITFNQYKALQENTKIAVLKTAKLASGNYMLGSELGYYSAKYEGYLWIVADNATAEQLAAKLSKDATAAVLTVDYDMDVNGNGVVTATDAGIIYDALKNHSVSSWAQIFELDVNGDKVVTATDVMLILNNVVGLD